jgi:GNAT superfamily N-acetyltransferase
MQHSDYTIRTMTRPEVDLALDWSAAEGWNPGLHDAGCFHAADPCAFLIGLAGDVPVAVISVARYGISFGFLGFYIVKPAYRGRGFGIRIWNAGMARLQGRCVGLDGVVAQQANYQRSGFRLAYRNIRFQGRGGGRVAPDPALLPLSTVAFEALHAYDRPFFPDDRSRFLKAWIDQPDATALGILDQGVLAGYGVLRPCLSGSKIGPLFADRVELAERLFVALKARATPGEPVFIDLPEVNPAALDLARRHGLTVGFETARMYTGECPLLPTDRVFGVTTFEFG